VRLNTLKDHMEGVEQLAEGKYKILKLLLQFPKTYTEIVKETGLSGPVVSDHLKSLSANNQITAPPKNEGLQRVERGAKYEIAPKGLESLAREEDHQFAEKNHLFLPFDLDPTIPKPIEGDSPPLPESILENDFPTFPVPINASLVMNENGRAAVDPWIYRMLGKYGYLRVGKSGELELDPDNDAKWIYEEVAYRFADPTKKKLCEVLFERTRVLCSLHSNGEKRSLPTMDNILNFNFQFSCRFEGEKFLNSASKEERIRAQQHLAGMLLLYLGGGGGGPMAESFSWHKEDLEALVESGLLTRREVQPLLECCKPFWRGLRYEECTDEQKRQWDEGHPPGVKVSHSGFYYPLLEDLTDEQKRKMQYDYPLSEQNLSDEQKRNLTISAYKRFYLADQETVKQKQIRKTGEVAS
jgi:DNA-binding transcriptional ArsR family regulator